MSEQLPDPPPPEQTFFDDPVLDRLMGATITLAAEVYMLRSRLRAVERTLASEGREPPAIDEDAERRDAMAFVMHVLGPTLGEQQSRGPL
jgi:hypothetical protein